MRAEQYLKSLAIGIVEISQARRKDSERSAIVRYIEQSIDR